MGKTIFCGDEVEKVNINITKQNTMVKQLANRNDIYKTKTKQQNVEKRCRKNKTKRTTKVGLRGGWNLLTKAQHKYLGRSYQFKVKERHWGERPHATHLNKANS